MIVGIDPGSKTTGMVGVERGKVIAAMLVVWHPDDTWAAHSDEVVAITRQWINVWKTNPKNADKLPLVRIEDTVAPTPWINGHKQFIDPAPLLTISKVIGYVVASFPTMAQLVRPGGHGSRQPLRACYPPILIGDRETTGVGGKNRHARAAFDIAMTPGLSTWRG